MRDSTETKVCRGCGTEFHLAFECKPHFCKACALVHDDYTPLKDGEPCTDCLKPVWYCNTEEQWFHEDPNHQCFLAAGKRRSA